MSTVVLNCIDCFGDFGENYIFDQTNILKRGISFLLLEKSIDIAVDPVESLQSKLFHKM